MIETPQPLTSEEVKDLLADSEHRIGVVQLFADRIIATLAHQQKKLENMREALNYIPDEACKCPSFMDDPDNMHAYGCPVGFRNRALEASS